MPNTVSYPLQPSDQLSTYLANMMNCNYGTQGTEGEVNQQKYYSDYVLPTGAFEENIIC